MNREAYPASLFPLRGDLSAEAGATTVEVVGIQTIPIADNPLIDGYVPTYTAANGDIEWKQGSGGGSNYFKVNGSPVSQDGLFFVDGNMILSPGDLFGLSVNGTRIP